MSSSSSHAKRKRTTPNENAAEKVRRLGWRLINRDRSPSPPQLQPLSGACTSEASSSQDPQRPSSNSQSPAGGCETLASQTADNAQTLYSSSNKTCEGSPPGLAPSKVTKPKSLVWARLEKALGAILDISANVCPSLQSAVDGLASCITLFEEAARNRQDYEELALDLETMANLLKQHLQNPSFTQLDSCVSIVAQAISEEVKLINERQNRSTSNRVLGTTGDEEDLLRRYRRIQQLFRRLQIEASMGTWSIANKNRVEANLERLNPAKLACHNSKLSTEIHRRMCTENTRGTVLSSLDSWSDDSDAEKIYWMNGMAGTGKTTIACTLATTLESRGQLAASFFCTHISQECRDANRIIPTIAYQLARHSTPFQSALCDALDNRPDLASLNPSTQFKWLLVEPLQSVHGKLAKNLIVVIDALDECDNTCVVELILDMLFQSASHLPLKFFITSRPEPTIRHKMMSQGIASGSILYLHEMDQSLVQADIEMYLQEELSFMQPTPDQIKQLTGLANNLFIYAATAVRYICPSRTTVDPNERLATFLSMTSPSKKRFMDIDILYSAILTSALDDNNLEPEEQDRVRRILWTTVCIREPVPVDTLAGLAGLGRVGQALAALQPLRSVLYVSESSGLASTLHASFTEYMLNVDRSRQFFCDEKDCNRMIAQHCFNLMKEQLRFNICNLESSFIFDSEVAGLKERVDRNISQPLSYACRYWGHHLTRAGVSDELSRLLNDFISERLLFWMEVLNLKRCIYQGLDCLGLARIWLTASSSWRDSSLYLFDSINDGESFLELFATSPASLCTPHIYISALPLSSASSMTFIRYRERMQGLIKLKGRALVVNDWKGYPAFDPQPIAFAPDGSPITFLRDDGAAYVCDIQGEKFEECSYDTGAVASVAFSPDGTRIICGHGSGHIRVWDVERGNLILGLLGEHNNPCASVFSPDGTRIVYGNYDGTISVWNTHQKGAQLVVLGSHTDGVRSVAFSPDGILLVSGSCDCTICIWNSYSGTLLGDPLEGHTDSVISVVFSPNGEHIASGSDDCTIRVWSTYTGMPISSPFEGHTAPVTSVSFSTDGTLVVSGSIDCTVRIWNTQNGGLVANFFTGYYDAVTSVAFSPDGTRIVSGSAEGSISVWHTQHMSQLHPALEGFLVVRDDGWLLNSHLELLFWIPNPVAIRAYFPMPNSVFTISPLGSLQADFSNLSLGERWYECYEPSSWYVSLVSLGLGCLDCCVSVPGLQ